MYGLVLLSGQAKVRVPLDPDELSEVFLTRVRKIASLSESLSLSLYSACDDALLPEGQTLRSLGVECSGFVFSVRGNVLVENLSLRQQLAASFHIAVIHGWDQLIYNHFTARLSPNSFLVHRFGHLYSQISASSLLEVNLDTGNVISDAMAPTVNDMPYNATAYVIHSCIYKARQNVESILHVHIPCIVAVASSKAGLKIGLSQESSLVGPVAYHDYEGLSTKLDEQERIVKNLGSKNVLFLRNHGVVICGESIAHALHVLYHVWRACLIQIASNSSFEDHFMPSREIVESAFDSHIHFTAAGNHNLEFAAMIRRLIFENPNHLFLR